jgi:poly(A) polymerase
LDDLIENPELDELEMYMVGGIVRDTLLGKTKSKDFDFIFRKVSGKKLEKALQNEKGQVDLVGRNFGVYKYTPKDSKLDEPIDIAFPRVEFAAGTGGKKDFEVQADPNLPVEKDLSRRDLTINAMAYDVREGKLIDPHGGKKDLENKIIRAVGNPHERFGEDYSRMLRAIRFACKFNFEIEEKTWQAIIENAKHLNDTRKNKQGKTEKIVPEDTIRKEMLKALAADPLRAFQLYDRAGLWEQIIPELNKLKGCEQPAQFHSEGDVWEHTRLMLENVNSDEFKKEFPNARIDSTFIFALMMHDIGKPECKKTIKKNDTRKTVFYGHEEEGAKTAAQIMKRLKFSKKQIERVKFLVENHMKAMSGDPNSFKNTTIEKYFIKKRGRDLLQLFFLDSLSSVRPDGLPHMENFNALKSRIEKIKKRKKEMKGIPDSILDGFEIMEALGRKKGGPYIAKAKKMLREEQLAGNINTKKQAKEFLLNNKDKLE